MDEHEFAKCLNRIALKVIELPWSEIIIEYDRLWEFVELNYSGDSDLLIEFHRGILESKIRFLPEETPLNVFFGVWREAVDLGFSSLERKGSMAFFWANYLRNLLPESKNEFVLAKQIIESVVDELKGAGQVDLAMHFSNVLVRLDR